MAATYRTAQGDMVDAICAHYYGDENGYTEAVYNANPGLAALGPVLPAGTVINLPDLKPVDVVSTEAPPRLWD